jgi:hypothetical protein
MHSDSARFRCESFIPLISALKKKNTPAFHKLLLIRLLPMDPGRAKKEGIMKAEQISVFLENKAGRLAEVTAILAEAEVNIRALALADTSDFGVLRLIVNDNERAETALKNQGFTVGKTDVVAVEVEDRPGGLHSILDILNREGVNVEYMYAFVQRSGDNAIMIFRFDNLDHAVEILQKNNVTVINGKEVYTL